MTPAAAWVTWEVNQGHLHRVGENVSSGCLICKLSFHAGTKSMRVPDGIGRMSNSPHPVHFAEPVNQNWTFFPRFDHHFLHSNKTHTFHAPPVLLELQINGLLSRKYNWRDVLKQQRFTRDEMSYRRNELYPRWQNPLQSMSVTKISGSA